MIVVESLSTTTRRARPSCETFVFSSLRPSSSVITSAPVRIAMSSSMRLRRSPKPGALTATAWNVPRSLLTTIVASDSPSTSSATISSGLPAWMTCSSIGQQILDGADLLVRDEDVRVLEHGLHALGVRDHVRRQVALVELHALGELELEAERLALLDVHDAVLADLLDRVGDVVADLALARRDARDPGDVLLARDLLRLRLQVLGHRVDGRLDAALERHRVRAGGDVLQALADDRLGEDGRGRRAVAGDVVRRRRDLAHELRALVLEDVLDLDLAGDRDTVVRDGGRAELLVEHDVAPLRAKGDLDRVGEDVHAALERAPRVLVELQLLVSHISSVPPLFVPG